MKFPFEFNTQGRPGCALVIAMLACLLLCAPQSAWAVIVGPGSHTFDGNLPANGIVNFNGLTFTTPAAPSANFGVAIDGGPLTQNYSPSSFNITGGFVLVDAFVFDATGNGITTGDSIFASVPAGGTFTFTDPGIILSGSFASAAFSSAVGSSAASLSASDVNTLVLTPGPAFVFDTSFVSSIDPSPTGFSISLSSITGGVTIGSSGAAIPLGGTAQLFPVTLLAGGSSTGSAVVSGRMNVVPEPSTITLMSLGVAVLATPAYLRWRRKTRR